jgi:prolyl oligopeptidase PreP (S9A serine peptidase family)
MAGQFENLHLALPHDLIAQPFNHSDRLNVRGGAFGGLLNGL